jgi:ATP synthase protein I
MSDEDAHFSREVASKVSLKMQAQRAAKQSIWLGFGVFGAVGWSVVVPTLAGAALGRWLDSHRNHAHSWTLALLVAGLVLGSANAWRWLSREIDGND